MKHSQLQPNCGEPTAWDSMDQSPLDPELAIESLLQMNSLEQLVLRQRGPEGVNVEVFQRVEFQPGQQTAVIHVPITPALDEIPDVESELISGQARVRITQRQRFGLRLEVILPQPCSETEIIRLRLNVVSAVVQPSSPTTDLGPGR